MTTWVENWRIAIDSLRANWFRGPDGDRDRDRRLRVDRRHAVSAGARKEVADSIRRLGGNGQGRRRVHQHRDPPVGNGSHDHAGRRREDRTAAGQNAVAPHQAIESLTVAAGEEQTITWLEGVTDQYSLVQNSARGGAG